MRPAVFLDRDGTIIREVHHIARPEQVEILPGAAAAIGDLRRAGFACVVVSNQSAVGRGMITLEDVRLVQAEVEKRLASEGVRIDGFYFSPIAPIGSDRRLVEHPERKPGPGMLVRAARELDLDLRASWMIGDMLSDLLAGRNAGCRASILVRTGHGGKADDETIAAADRVVDDLGAAARLIVQTAAGRPLRPTERRSPNE